MSRKRVVQGKRAPKRKAEVTFPVKVAFGSWGGIFDKEVTLRGRRYYFYKSRIKLANAKILVKELRGKGYKARIIVSGLLSGYGVYSYPKIGGKS